MGSGVIYYLYEKCEKFEDYDMKADAELRTFKIKRYHFDDESFVHPLHSVRFDPDRSYEIPIEALMADKPLSSSRDGKSSTRRVASKKLRMPKNWELILSSEGWMCKGDDKEKEIGGMEPSVGKKDTIEEDPEEEDPEEEVHASSPLPMDIDATEDYRRFIEDLDCRPEYSLIRSGHTSVLDSPEDASDRQSDGHNTSSYDLSGVWQPPSLSPSL
ncbi:hypothetical protein PIB30_024805 [Stylosanthes scabra]|uniref:Uncharacterized protein n=1 Tax=Stylosanthes scabra TaxID=79078 RepID=A0ABU6WCX2_9FABA|nr:hypothetical protein [Stylosanthes scabra]